MAFYQCPKCQRVWQYPIEKCFECFLELKKMTSEKIKVIGVSKVTIPTMFHPKVPYFVLLLEDENGNKWVQKSQREYKTGDIFETQPSDDKKAVAIWRIKYDILEGIEKVIDLVGGLNFNQNLRILILPTLVSPRHPYFAENTSPQFLGALLKYLIARGVKSENIKVGGQSFDEVPIEASAQKSQLLEICQENKILPLDLAKTNFIKKTEGQLTFEISEEVFNSDLVINLPILKMGKISASENVLKFLKKENYLGLKYLFSDEEIITNLNKVLPQYLTITEALSVQKSDGFISHLGLILASFHSLNLDRVFAEITMTKELPEFLRKVKIEDIPIVGRQIGELQFEAEKY